MPGRVSRFKSGDGTVNCSKYGMDRICRDIKLKYRTDEEGQRIRAYESSFQINRKFPFRVGCPFLNSSSRLAPYRSGAKRNHCDPTNVWFHQFCMPALLCEPVMLCS